MLWKFEGLRTSIIDVRLGGGCFGGRRDNPLLFRNHSIRGLAKDRIRPAANTLAGAHQYPPATVHSSQLYRCDRAATTHAVTSSHSTQTTALTNDSSKYFHPSSGHPHRLFILISPPSLVPCKPQVLSSVRRGFLDVALFVDHISNW